jgi:hypothetical protein
MRKRRNSPPLSIVHQANPPEGTRVPGDELIQHLIPEEELKKARESMVAADGARAAGWLVKKHRTQLRTVGAVDFHLELDARQPTWFWVAIEFLRWRKGWLVERIDLPPVPDVDFAGRKIWRVSWVVGKAYKAALKKKRNQRKTKLRLVKGGKA